MLNVISEHKAVESDSWDPDTAQYVGWGGRNHIKCNFVCNLGAYGRWGLLQLAGKRNPINAVRLVCLSFSPVLRG